MNKPVEIDTMLKEMCDELARCLAQGMTTEEARLSAESLIRRTYAGERIYVAGQPKRQRAIQLAKLELRTTREMAVASGMNVRTVRRIVTGR